MSMTPLHPTANLRKKINVDGAKSAGPLLHGWARRTSRGLPSTARQVRALNSYMQTAPKAAYESLGGADTVEWLDTALNHITLEDTNSRGYDGELIVLGLPYYGPNGGRDNDGQYFSPMTDFMDGVLDTPPVYYVHGSQNGFEPEPIGKVKNRWYDRQGGWFTVELDHLSPRYSQMLEAQIAGTLRASSGAIPASVTVSNDGHIDTWVVGELSLVDLRDGFQPINAYAIAKAEEVLFTDYYGDAVLLDEAVLLIDQLIEQEPDLSNKAKLLELFEKVTQFLKADTSIIEDEESETEDMPTTEKCIACDEAKALAETIKAEITEAVEQPVKCARCPEAVTWVQTMFKAGRIKPGEAFVYLEQFTESDAQFDTVKAEVEARNPLMVKAQVTELLIAGGQPVTPQTQIDGEYMNRQRRMVGLPTK